MRDIKITNFRCYAEKTMEFRRGINLLIGDNSVGKTSLLEACKLAINSFFCGYSDEYTKWKSPTDEDFREIKTDDIQLPEELPINITFHLDENDCPPIVLPGGQVISLQAKKSMDDSSALPDLVFEKKSKKNARNLVTGLKPLRDFAAACQKYSHSIENNTATQHYALPVYAYYTTEDIHSVRKFDRKKKNFKKYPQKPTFGYSESHDSKGFLDCWITRLLTLREAKKGEVEVRCVTEALKKALGQDGCGIIADIDIRPIDGKVYFIFCDGREVHTDLLSDGYRRLVSIVTDIAFRCALLNKTKFGEEAYLHSHGTVIIDEIDEHLHPELQAKVLDALHSTFPHIQFIVSTHSPLVISSVKKSDENIVYKLAYEDGVYTHEVYDTYGLDANSVITLMGALVRPGAVEQQIKHVRSLLSDMNIEEAKQALQKLETITEPEQVDLIQLRAILNRLEILGR